MNIKNNKRRKESQDKIMKGFIEMLQTRELFQITVSDIIKSTGLNRSTFYANYADIYELADQTRMQLENEFTALFADYNYMSERSGALRMFRHIKENQIFYLTYFKLCYSDRHLISIYDERRAEQEHIDSNIKYHIEFFRNGFNAIVKMWLAGGCKETPEEMAQVLQQEYRGR